MTDDRTYIKLHDGMPRHPKVRGLSDKAFRTFVSALCYCSEYLTDGEVVSAVARDLGAPKVWAELTAAGLAESAPGGYLMHDYLQHQRSAEQVGAIREAKRKAGSKGGRAKAAALAAGKQEPGKPLAGASPAEAQDVSRIGNGGRSLVLNRASSDAGRSAESALFPSGEAVDAVGDKSNSRRSASRKPDSTPGGALAPTTGAATDVPRSKTGSKTYPETESLTNVRDQTETDSSLRSEAAQKRGSRIPDDFSITEEMRAWGRARGFTDSQIDEVTEQFVRYWRGKSGRDATKRDWPGTWQNWLAKEDPARVRVAPRPATANGQRKWTNAELDAVLGADLWVQPDPPGHLDSDAKHVWWVAAINDHRAERIRQAEERSA